MLSCAEKSGIYLTSTYYWWLLRQTIPTPFKISNNRSTIQFEMNKKHYSHSTRPEWLICQALCSSVSATELHRQPHWLKIHQWMTYTLYIRDQKHCLPLSPDSLLSTLQSADKLLLSVVPWMAFSLSAKAFSISAPSVCNSMSLNCRSDEVFRQCLQWL